MPTSAQAGTIDRARLLSDLRALGIAPGMVLGVHSSLRRVGWVQGGADTVIAALMDAVGPEGTLIMPHYRVSMAVPVSAADRAAGVDYIVRRISWTDLRARTGMGRIADAFAQRSDVARGPQRVHTQVAWGPRAGRFCQGYEPLLRAGGSVLLLGVQFDRCSVLHAAEPPASLPADLPFVPAPPVPPDVARRFSPEEFIVGMAGVGFSFMAMRRAAEGRGLLRHGRVGAADAILLQAAPVVALFESLMRDDPRSLLDTAG
jgi:aminoglycoside 3-N-acetyltransferase